MPIYEFRCQSCAGVTSLFVRSIGDPLSPVCGHCQSPDMTRRMSSFAMGRSGKPGREGPSPGAATTGLDYYRDPRNIGRNVEESYSRHGLDMPHTVRETIEAAREGQLPGGLDI